MSMLKLVKATEEQWEEAYDLFYRTLRKLMSEGKGDLFGGMTPEGTKRSVQNGNFLYLVYRKGDQLPVAAISCLKEENYQKYAELLKYTPEENVLTLNAMSVRPELWGQGYARQSLRLCIEELGKEGFTTIVGTAHPGNSKCFKTLKYANGGMDVTKTAPFTWTTPKGRVLERVRFMFHI
mgnify:CR=1 FL=1